MCVCVFFIYNCSFHPSLHAAHPGSAPSFRRRGRQSSVVTLCFVGIFFVCIRHTQDPRRVCVVEGDKHPWLRCVSSGCFLFTSGTPGFRAELSPYERGTKLHGYVVLLSGCFFVGESLYHTRYVFALSPCCQEDELGARSEDVGLGLACSTRYHNTREGHVLRDVNYRGSDKTYLLS